MKHIAIVIGFCLTLAISANAQLIISEVVIGAESGDCPRFIEITNTGMQNYTFPAGGLIIQSGDSTDVDVDEDLTGVTIRAGQSYVICSNLGCTGAFLAVFGFNANRYTMTDFEGGDARVILTDAADGSNLIDIYGEFGVDGTGQPWEYLRGYAYRLPAYNSGTGQTFEAGQWFLGGLDSLAGDNPTLLLQTLTTPATHDYDEIAGEEICLIISEVVCGAESGDCPNWVEITNTGSTDFTFTEGGIIVQADNKVDVAVDVNLTGVTILAGQSYVVSSSANGCSGAFQGVYQMPSDMEAIDAVGDGNDRYILTDTADGSHLIDIYGFFGTNGLGTPWEYTRGYSYRLSPYNSGNGSNFQPSEWVFGGVGSLDGPDPTGLLLTYTTPKVHVYDQGCGAVTTAVCCHGFFCYDVDPDDPQDPHNEAQCLEEGGVYLTGVTCNDVPCDCDGTDYRGDANCLADGPNSYDIDHFIQAVGSAQTWIAEHSCNLYCANDCNCDGSVNAYDIDWFITCVGNSVCDPCP
ncbi:MAG: hypothetical protein ABIG44_18740 [Planctomycetota bacterium]